MAINAATIWEFRAASGSATNGGGYANLNPGTSVDYSDQDSSQLSLSDCATSGIGVTTLTSVTGGFTAAMEGNVMYLHTGTNLVDGWYQITGYTDGNTVTLDRAPDDGVGGVSAGDCEVGGALDILTDTFIDDDNVVVAGNTIWIKNDGTMTLTGNISTDNAGTDTNVITIEGYNTSRGDNPTSTNCPLIACGANTFDFIGKGWWLKHLRGTTTEASGADLASTEGRVINCYFNNSSGTANRNAFTLGSYMGIFGCEGQSANGRGLSAAFGSFFHACYAHDSSSVGFACSGSGIRYVSCVADTCGYGVSVATSDHTTIISCTIYNCTNGVSGTTGNNANIVNNIIDSCTTGVNWSNSYGSNHLDYNCWNNTTDTNNVIKGDNAVTGDSGMTDPANGDFTITSGSNCSNAALDAGDLTGATV